MAGQAIWSGTVSFSLVAIPVRLVGAVRPGKLAFRLLHKPDNSPLRRVMVCPTHGGEVEPGETVRGYELAPGHYLQVTKAELESVAPERSRTIEIQEFVDAAELDPALVDRPYYLVPMKGGEKSCRLLAKVLEQTRKVGLARFVLGEREHFAALIARDGALALLTLHYPEELVDEGSDPLPEIDAGLKAEAVRTVETMTAGFDPAKYADARREKILRLAGEKAKGAVVVEAPPEPEEDFGPPDLMAILEEAMREVKKGG